MNKIKLLIADANNNFTTDDAKKFETATLLADQFISKNFNFDYEVNVIVVPPSYLINVIPEDGISGKTYRSDLIVIVVDTKSGVPEDFFYETLCHELSHSLRWQKVPEHSVALMDDIIFEGLAVTLEEKAMVDEKKDNIQFFLKEMQTTNQSTIDKILSELSSKLNDDSYDYNKIFMTGDDSLPRWAGYRLGYYLVKKYLRDNKVGINEVTVESFDDIKAKL